MEWYGQVWCITLEELCRDDRTEANQAEFLAPALTRGNYDTLAKRGKLQVVRQGKGKGNYALIAYDSLPASIKERVQAKYPDIEVMRGNKTSSSFDALCRRAYARDYNALSYYYATLTRLNLSLSDERIEELANEYTTNASVIQAVQKIRSDNQRFCRVRGRRGRSWSEMTDVLEFFRDEYGHTLGVSPTRFAKWVNKYNSDGYDALISKKFGNANTVKMTARTERLLMELAGDKHRPHSKTIWEWYCAFLRGEETYISPVTGELYDPSEFPDLSEKTIGDVLQRIPNQASLSKKHDSRHDYQTMLRPHHKREKPRFALSMVSMDDKDFAIKIKYRMVKRKQVRGKQVEYAKTIETSLKAYLCYDVASEAIIGYAFSGEKNADLFESCVRNMYRNLLSWGLGQPYEAQVENHLVSLYKDTMMRDGVLFPVVSFAGAENSQEKYAERHNEVLKYQFEKYAIDHPVGRPHARLRANRTKNRKVSDGANNNYVQEVYDFAEAIRAYEQIIEAYNNAPHPKQKIYPNKSRLDVLKTCVHPSIKAIDMHQLARWAGKRIETSVNDRGLVRAYYEDYAVSIEMQDRLRGRHGEVTAYLWQTSEDEPAEEIYLYQGDVLLGLCPRVVPYQVSKLERTSEDMRLMGVQRARIQAFDREMERRAPEGLIRVSSDVHREIEIQPIAKIIAPLEEDTTLEDEELYRQIRTYQTSVKSRALADL